MTTAKLRISLPEGVWVADVTRSYPASHVTVLAAIPRERAGFALARIEAPELDSVLDAVRTHPAIEELSILGRTDREATIQFKTSRPLLLFSAKESGMPIELPINIREGTATVEVTGSRDRLQQLCQQLDQFGLEFEVIYVQEYRNPAQLLSNRQRELLLEAIEQGYYDSPRGCTLTELADSLDIAKSTCSEILHRAEGTILKHYVERMPTAMSIPETQTT